MDLVKENCYTVNVVGLAMFQVSKKLKALKKPLKDFSKLINYSDLENRTKEAHELLLRCQDLTLGNPSCFNVAHELEAQRKWHILSFAEESFFLQKSRLS